MELNVPANLSEQGLVLPPPPKPGGAYESVRVLGSLAYVAVQFPYRDGQPAYQGRLGRELTTTDGYEAMQLCALNVLAQIDRYVGFPRVLGLNTIEAHMQTVEGWGEFPRVLDGASHLLLHALGDAGRHARALCGVERLPRNFAVALTATFTLHTPLLPSPPQQAGPDHRHP